MPADHGFARIRNSKLSAPFSVLIGKGASRSLRLSTLSIVGLILVALCAVFYAVSSLILLAGYAKLEEQQMQAQLMRLQGALQAELDSLKATTQDWAWWDDSYAFMKDGDAHYPQTNLTEPTLKNLDIDFMLLLRMDGSLAHAVAGGQATQMGLKAADILRSIVTYPVLLARAKDDGSLAGFISVADAPALIAASAILSSDQQGPSRGVLIMGRLLTGIRLQRLSDQTQSKVSIASFKFPPLLSIRNPQVVRIINEDTLAGYQLLAGLQNAPAASLKVETDRWIYQQGKSSQRYLLLNLVIMGLAFTVLIMWLLEQLVLTRLTRFGQTVDEVARSQDWTIRLADGNGEELDHLAGAINHVLDIQQQTRDLLLHDALHDPLTGMANRALLMDRLEHALKQAERRNAQASFAVLVLDLDRFKLINESFGHGAGDQLLLTVAQRMNACLRGADTVARLGGDEFAILLTPIRTSADASRIAERLLRDLMTPIEWQERHIQTSASIGIAVHASTYHSAEHLLRDAEIAMYRAKHKGRNCHEIFDQHMHAQVLARLELEHDLRRALERDELEAHYQPIVDLRRGEITGFEALARWRHPQRGLVSPLEFIPVAEEIGIIHVIDRWVLGEACRFLNRLHTRFPDLPTLKVSVNVSCKHLHANGLAVHVHDVLAATRLGSQHLSLEITETALFEAEDKANFMLFELRDQGLHLYLDDFGTGYSSLNRLHRLPIQILKIDRSFTRRIDEGETEIIRTIATLAHSLDMEVVAEGVETAEQMQKLLELGCEYGQGYYFSRPLPEQDIVELLLRRPRWA